MKSLGFKVVACLIFFCICMHGYTAKSSNILWRKNSFDSENPMNGFKVLSKGQFDEGSLSVVRDPAGGKGKVLRVFIKKGSYGGVKDRRGAQFYTDVGSSRTSMKLSYQIYFQRGMDFVKGGKLPGLYGGDQTCSGGRRSDKCVSTRFMWRREGEGEVYAYIPSNQVSNFCSTSNIVCNDDYGDSLGRGNWEFQTGRWQTIVQRIKLNEPGRMNGQVTVWLNGKRVYQRSKVNFRTNNNVKLKGMFFSVFFGGGSSSWAPTADSRIYFRNFVISK